MIITNNRYSSILRKEREGFEAMKKDYNKTDYPFHQAQKVAERFERIFGVPFKNFFDSKMSMLLFQHITIDIVKFDEWCERIFPNEYKDGVSLQKFIVNRFGYKGWRLIRDLLF